MRVAPALLLGVAWLAGCSEAPPADPRPSILLVVIDTLRADAVSAYGRVEGTTPETDALAASGLLYSRAFAPAPWTLPSHATLFTGQPVERHGVGVGGAAVLDDSLPTLAERLTAAGYRTAGFSENPLVGRHFGLHRGFARFAGATVEQALRRPQTGEGPRFDVVRAVERFAERGGGRPAFVFVNLFEPHDPYRVREENPFAPRGASRAELEAAGRGVGLCSRLPGPERLGILRGLYLGEVAAADAKLGRLHRALAAARPGAALVTVVTSDHGEHLGEHRLMGHEFSVRNVTLHVPLVVSGLPGVEPAVIDTPVTLADVSAAVLHWAGVEAAEGLPIRSVATDATPRPLFALYSDAPPETPDTVKGGEVDASARLGKRRACGPEDRVFGDTVALLRFPWKLIWFEGHDPQLYDLSWDGRELSDRAADRPQLAARLAAEVERYRRGLGRSEAAAPDAEAAEALRQLGYAE